MSVHPLRQHSAMQRAQLRWHRRPQAIRRTPTWAVPKPTRLQRVLAAIHRWHKSRAWRIALITINRAQKRPELWVVLTLIFIAGDAYWSARALGWQP